MTQGDTANPPCPDCSSADTKRLPFCEQADGQYRVYACVECGHVWRLVIATIGPDPQDFTELT